MGKAKILFLCFCMQGLGAILTCAGEFQTKDQQFIDSLRQYEFVHANLSEIVTAEYTNELPEEERKVLSFAFQERIVYIRLTLNRNLFSPNFHERRVIKHGYEIEKESPRDCYFHGEVEGHKGRSFAAISSCDGIEGSFTLNDKSYQIQPLKSLNGEVFHIVYESENLPAESHCGRNHSEHVLLHEKIEENAIVANHRVRRDVLSETKYIELMIVNSKSQYERFGKTTLHRAISVANHADATYRLHNIRVVLIVIETWTVADQIVLSNTNNDKSLKTFYQYKKNVLDKNETTRSDHSVYITQHKLANGRNGYAGVATMCSQRSVSLLYDEYESISISAAVMSHELGHSLGLLHIPSVAECPCGKSYCLMSATVSYLPLLFSNCTKVALEKEFLKNYGTCLFNKPGEHYRHAKCGNSWIDAGEECDCGSDQECKAKGNHCCDPKTCKLYSHSQCSDGPCCENCKIKPRGSICRDKVNDCDLPEYCNGKSAVCAPDAYVYNGRPCSVGQEESLCYLGVCHTYDNQCKVFWGQEAIFPKSYDCYGKVNIKGSKYGYCKDYGNGTYLKCSSKDAKCGKLQCEFSPARNGPTYPKIGHSLVTLKYHTCWSATSYLGADVPVAGMVETGSMCAENKVCYDNVCTDVNTVYKQPECPNNCSGNGICNNYGHCHCNYGYGCPNCSVKCDSVGGSIDSGGSCYCPGPNISTTAATTQRSSTGGPNISITAATTQKVSTGGGGVTTEISRASTELTGEATTRRSSPSTEPTVTTDKIPKGVKGKSERLKDIVKIVVPVVLIFILFLALLLCFIFRAYILERCRKIRRTRNTLYKTPSIHSRVNYGNNVTPGTDDDSVRMATKAGKSNNTVVFTSLLCIANGVDSQTPQSQNTQTSALTRQSPDAMSTDNRTKIARTDFKADGTTIA